MSAMTDSSDTATIPGPVVLDSGVVPCFKVESGILAQTKKVSTPPGRLTSLRTRDLTLSGAFKKSKVCTEVLITHHSMNLVIHKFFFLLKKSFYISAFFNM